MKSYRKLFATIFAALFIAATAFAADASPAGTWKWTQVRRGPGGGGGGGGGGQGQGIEQTLKLDLKDGKLTGTLVGTQSPMGQIPDAAISDASFKDGVVKFSVSRTFGERTMVSKYEGKLEGDTIKGTTERQGRDGQPQKSEWTATRAK